MLDYEAVPRRLRRLAFLWLVVGVLSLFGLKLELQPGFGTINVGILGLAFGPGLILAWRWVPIAIRWVSWLTIILFFFVATSGLIRGGVNGWAAAAIGILLICMVLEQLYILKLPEVRNYYEASRRAR